MRRTRCRATSRLQRKYSCRPGAAGERGHRWTVGSWAPWVPCRVVPACRGLHGTAASQAVIEPSAPPATPSPAEHRPSASDEPNARRPAPSRAVVDPAVPRFAEFDAAKFSNGADITNRWLPLQPGAGGSRWSNHRGGRIPHRITFTVTNLTKMIDGVETVVAYVEDYTEASSSRWRSLSTHRMTTVRSGTSGASRGIREGRVRGGADLDRRLDEAKPGIKMFADPSSHPEPGTRATRRGRVVRLRPPRRAPGRGLRQAGCFGTSTGSPSRATASRASSSSSRTPRASARSVSVGAGRRLAGGPLAQVDRHARRRAAGRVRPEGARPRGTRTDQPEGLRQTERMQ